MPDHAASGLPRIALVFGDETAAAHVRAAVQDHADIAYATSAADFDPARIADANITAALVNLDSSDWLDMVEPRLEAAGVPVVYNDPDISRGLDGWARARWLRHLLAKLRGSADVDPPRPEPTVPSSRPLPAAIDHSPEPALQAAGIVERPLSPQEIETMTADFVAEQEAAGAQTGKPAPQPAKTDASAGNTDADAAARVPTDESGSAGADDLDVDTETLSAMIDARIADAESQGTADSPEVWRVVEGGSEPAARSSGGHGPGPTGTVDATAGQPGAAAGGKQDDDDVSSSLPSLDDWQLVDADAEPAPVARHEPKNIAPELPESLVGLELEPMESVANVVHTEPIERWLNKSEPRKSAAKASGAPEPESVGDKA